MESSPKKVLRRNQAGFDSSIRLDSIEELRSPANMESLILPIVNVQNNSMISVEAHLCVQ